MQRHLRAGVVMMQSHLIAGVGVMLFEIGVVADIQHADKDDVWFAGQRGGQ